MTRAIFLVARLLADEQNPGRFRPFAENGLRGVLVKVAAVTALNSLSQHRKRFALRKIIGGGHAALFRFVFVFAVFERAASLSPRLFFSASIKSITGAF